MSFAKRDAWLTIYNDFLETRGSDNSLKVNTKEDFFELFRNWEF